METFGKTAWLILLAGSVALPFAGCTKSPAERFETYNQLKKSDTDQPATSAAKKDDAGPRLTSTSAPTAKKVVTTSATPIAAPKSVTAPSTSASAVPAKNGTNGTSGVYQASVASSGPSPGVVPAAATGAAPQGSVAHSRPQIQDGRTRGRLACELR